MAEVAHRYRKGMDQVVRRGGRQRHARVLRRQVTRRFGVRALSEAERPGALGSAFAAVALLTAACASGGGGPPVAGAEAEALFADLSGVWVLDEESSSPPAAVTLDAPESANSGSFTIIKGPGEQGRIIGDIPAERAPSAIRNATFEVLERRPRILALRVDRTWLVYRPSSGENIRMAIAGGSVSGRVERENVHTRVFWDGAKPGLEHTVGALGKVREVFEVVDGRLVMTRTLRLIGETVLPLVLVYDRGGRTP